ncbi:hypothetical protein CI238_00723 [Colletotrichum incanum]|uniref:Uncharacterized protein n=1 Tax=Colletotrichum incanum TaxID=1573173 RepID=A0A166RPC2_COLIC|nr:hypothetical protein CI238_00723 [Colletotrichum incanum]
MLHVIFYQLFKLKKSPRKPILRYLTSQSLMQRFVCPSSTESLVDAANEHSFKMSGIVPALAKNMPSHWFASIGCVVAGSSEVFLWALCAACITMLTTSMYYHSRPICSGMFKSAILYCNIVNSLDILIQPVLHFSGSFLVHRADGIAPLVRSEELTPNTTIGRKLFRYRKQGESWNEYDLPEGSTLKINRCSTVLITKT